MKFSDVRFIETIYKSGNIKFIPMTGDELRYLIALELDDEVISSSSEEDLLQDYRSHIYKSYPYIIEINYCDDDRKKNCELATKYLKEQGIFVGN
jgi:hypothetical protein